MHPRPRRRSGHLLLMALSALLLSASVTTAGAQEPGGWGIGPAGPGNGSQRDFFVYQLQPGQGFQDTVAISNLTDAPLTFTVVARDAFNTPGDGGFALQDTDATPEDAGGWVELPVSEYTVEPRSRAEIPFNIVVPPDAEPGDHAAGIIATLAPTNDPNAGEFDVRVERRIAARVYVRVEGPLRPAVAIEALELDYSTSFDSLFTGEVATVRYVVKNVGNVRMTPIASLSLKDPFGRTVATVTPRQLPELLPGSTANATVVIDDVRPPGRLTAELSVEATGEATSSTRRSTSVWAVPWPVILVLVAAIAWRRLRRRRAARRGPLSERRPKREPAHV